MFFKMIPIDDELKVNNLTLYEYSQLIKVIHGTEYMDVRRQRV